LDIWRNFIASVFWKYCKNFISLDRLISKADGSFDFFMTLQSNPKNSKYIRGLNKAVVCLATFSQAIDSDSVLDEKSNSDIKPWNPELKSL